MKIELACCTDKGILRKQNEDNVCIYVLPTINGCLLAVADGIGGYKAGEIASKIAIQVVECIRYNNNAENGGVKIQRY